MLYPAVLPTDGATGMLDTLIQWLNNPLSSFRVHLYANAYSPVAASVPASFTDPVFGGYSPLTPLGPTALPTTPGGRVIWQWPQSVWTATGPGLPVICWGFWTSFTDPISLATRVGWAQRFQSPQGLWLAGQTIKLALSLGGKQC